MFKFNRFNPKSFEHVPRIPYWDSMIIKRFKHRHEMKKWYQTLEVAEDCEDETLRLAFVYQAKRFHPDSGTPEADAVKFSEIETAYRQIRKARMEMKESSRDLPDAEEFDIKHTAPQHRHYLVHNVGIGSPSKRQKLHTMERAQKAADSVLEHRLKRIQSEERNTLVGMDKERARDVKTRFGVDRLVEDLIQEAMNKGEFQDLPGIGKPLKENTNLRNPYVDFVTYKLNEILIENGFTPEWIQLSKEIREEIEDLRKKLTEARSNVGQVPLNPMEEASWSRTVDDFRCTSKRINGKIDKYNLLVPILQKQMLHVKLEELAEEALSVAPRKVAKKRGKNSDEDLVASQGDSLFDSIISMFNKKVE